MKMKKSSIIVSLIAVAAIIALAWFFLRPQGKVAFSLAPEEMTLSINDKHQVIRHNQTVSLNPGTYTFKFSHNAFSTETKTVTVKNNETINFAMALNPQTDAARKIISDNPESVKIIEKYKLQQETELALLMPINGTGFSIKSCRSAKQPQSGKKAFCITTQHATSERLAKLYIKQLGYNPDTLEMMAGSKNLMTILSTDSYKVEVYSTDKEEKPTLYITPLNVPYVPPNAPRNEQLESIRTESLKDLESQEYVLNDYIIIFSNMYLSRYNADHVHSNDGDNSLE